MAQPVRTGVSVIGVIFLLLAVLKFAQGKDWVVWAILGVLFGGLSVFKRAPSPGDRS